MRSAIRTSFFYGELIRLVALLGLRLPRPHEGRHLGYSMHCTEILPGANRHKRPLWAEFVFAIDGCLQWREGVFEYSHQPDCIFRAQLSRLSSDVLLSDGTFGRPGDRVIDLHLWNEQIPVTPIAGYSLAWGCRFNRSFAKSLGGLDQFLMNKPELSDVSIIRANINLDPLHRIAARHGFEAIRDPIKLSPWETRASVRPKYSVLAVDACVSFRPCSTE